MPTALSINDYYIDQKDFQKIVIAGLGGIFISKNGGNSWESLTENLQGVDIPKNIPKINSGNLFDTATKTRQKWIKSLAINPISADIIAIGTQTEGVLISNDSGKTWVQMNRGLGLKNKIKITSLQ